MYAISVAALPNLTDIDIDNVYNAAVQTDSDGNLNKQLSNSIFVALSQRYLNQTLVRLLNYSRAQKPKTHIIMKKKKTAALNVRQTVLLSVSSIIRFNSIFNTISRHFPNSQANFRNSITFTPEQQDRLYDIIEGALPDPSLIHDYAEEADSIAQVIPLLQSATASKKLIQKTTVVPLFAECLPQLVGKVPGTEELIDTMAHCWAYHLEFTSIARNMNQTIVNLCFKLLPSSATLKIIISVFSTYLDRVDPLPFVNFLYLAVVKAYEGQLFIDHRTIANFILLITPLTLSFSSEVHHDAVNIIFTLFNSSLTAETAKTSQSSFENVGDPSTGQMVERVRSLYGEAMKTATDELVVAILEELSKLKVIEIGHAILIEGMVKSKPTLMITAPNSRFLGMILDIADSNIKAKEKTQAIFFLEKALFDLAKNQIFGFLPLLLFGNSTTQFKKELLQKLMRSQSHRALFIDCFHSILVSMIVAGKFVNNSKQLAIFSILLPIIESEANQQLPEQTFATIISDLLLWLTALFQDNTHSNKKSVEIFELTVEKIIQKLPIYNPPEFHINVSDFEHYSMTINQLSNILSLLPIKQIESLSAFIFTFVQNSNKPPDSNSNSNNNNNNSSNSNNNNSSNGGGNDGKNSEMVFNIGLTGGLFFLHMASLFERFTTNEARQFKAKLFAGLSKAFSAVSGSQLRLLARDCDSRLYPPSLKQISVSVLKDVMESLIHFTNQTYYSETLHFLSILLSFQEFKNAITHDQILILLRIIFSSLKFQKWHLSFLDIYVQKDPKIEDFKQNDQLTLKVFFRILTINDDQIRRSIRQFLFTILNQQLVSTILNVFGEPYLIDIGLNSLSLLSKESVDMEWMNLLFDMTKILMKSQSSKASEFRREIMKFMLPIASNKEHPLQNKAGDFLRLLIE